MDHGKDIREHAHVQFERLHFSLRSHTHIETRVHYLPRSRRSRRLGGRALRLWPIYLCARFLSLWLSLQSMECPSTLGFWCANFVLFSLYHL
jgi:hypothetical protein